MTTTVVKMEDSGEHKKIYQKFKRLAETKKDELAYKYNPVRKYNVLKYLFLHTLLGRGCKSEEKYGTFVGKCKENCGGWIGGAQCHY